MNKWVDKVNNGGSKLFPIFSRLALLVLIDEKHRNVKNSFPISGKNEFSCEVTILSPISYSPYFTFLLLGCFEFWHEKLHLLDTLVAKWACFCFHGENCVRNIYVSWIPWAENIKFPWKDFPFKIFAPHLKSRSRIFKAQSKRWEKWIL